MHTPIARNNIPQRLYTQSLATRSRDAVQQFAIAEDIIGNAYYCGRQFNDAELPTVLPSLCLTEPDTWFYTDMSQAWNSCKGTF